MRYFDHDTDAAKDEKIQALRISCGSTAVDSYWSILECIYREEKPLVIGENQPETKALTHWLCTDWSTFEKCVLAMSDCGLFDVSVDDESGCYIVSSRRAQANIEDYQAKRVTARQNGKKGGRPRKRSTDVEPGEKPSKTKVVSKPLTKEKEKEKENIKEELPKGSSKKASKFSPPSVAEVRDYAATRGTPIDAERFVDYFTAQGWKLSNGNAMRDWQAAVRNWCSRNSVQHVRGVVADDELAAYGI